MMIKVYQAKKKSVITKSKVGKRTISVLCKNLVGEALISGCPCKVGDGFSVGYMVRGLLNE